MTPSSTLHHSHMGRGHLLDAATHHGAVWPRQAHHHCTWRTARLVAQRLLHLAPGAGPEVTKGCFVHRRVTVCHCNPHHCHQGSQKADHIHGDLSKYLSPQQLAIGFTIYYPTQSSTVPLLSTLDSCSTMYFCVNHLQCSCPQLLTSTASQQAGSMAAHIGRRDGKVSLR